MYQTEVGMQVLWGECTQELWACTSSVSSWSQIVPSRLGLQVCNHQFPRPNHRVLSYAPVMCESCWQGCHCHQVGKGMWEGWLGGMGVYQHFSERCTHLGFPVDGNWEPGFTAAQLYFRSTELPSIFGLTSSTGSGSTPMGGKTEEKAQQVYPTMLWSWDVTGAT